METSKNIYLNIGLSIKVVYNISNMSIQAAIISAVLNSKKRPKQKPMKEIPNTLSFYWIILGIVMVLALLYLLFVV
jgi:hypothetical protein